jgi:hypothetical protein
MRWLVCHASQCSILSGKMLSLLMANMIDESEIDSVYQKYMVVQHCMLWELGYSTRSV